MATDIASTSHSSILTFDLVASASIAFSKIVDAKPTGIHLIKFRKFMLLFLAVFFLVTPAA